MFFFFGFIRYLFSSFDITRCMNEKLPGERVFENIALVLDFFRFLFFCFLAPGVGGVGGRDCE